MIQEGNLPSVSPPMEIVACSLKDLIHYFLPLEGLSHEAKQNNMTALKNRQNMFQEEVNLCGNYSNWHKHVTCWSIIHTFTLFSSQGVIDLVLDCIDRLHQYSSGSHFAAHNDAQQEWVRILNNFYELLGENQRTSYQYRWLNTASFFTSNTHIHITSKGSKRGQNMV